MSTVTRWLEEDLKADLKEAEFKFIGLCGNPVVANAVRTLLAYFETQSRQKLLGLKNANAATFPVLQAELKAIDANMLDVQELLKKAEKKHG